MPDRTALYNTWFILIIVIVLIHLYVQLELQTYSGYSSVTEGAVTVPAESSLNTEVKLPNREAVGLDDCSVACDTSLNSISQPDHNVYLLLYDDYVLGKEVV